MSQRDPKLAADALSGLRAYSSAPRHHRTSKKPAIESVRGTTLRDHGGSGPPLVLVPSLINPPRILDLDEEVSLASAIARMGRRVLLVDWGIADAREDLSVAGHIESLLLPLLRNIGEPTALAGYCLGGTMAIAAANLVEVERVVTLASPWHFTKYPEHSKKSLQDMWLHSRNTAQILGALPMEVLQAAFWSLDPERTVQKFAEFAQLDPESRNARRFIELEEWANEGEALPYPAAQELVEDLFEKDLSGTNSWMVGGQTISGRLDVPALHLTAERDLIAPPETAGPGKIVPIRSGHVGMIVGSARTQLHDALGSFLDPGCR